MKKQERKLERSKTEPTPKQMGKKIKAMGSIKKQSKEEKGVKKEGGKGKLRKTKTNYNNDR